MPSLQVLRGPGEGTVLPLNGQRWVLGRNPGCDVVLPITSVSREHARIVRRGDDYVIEDRHSRNGTFVNNQAIDGPRVLRNNDRIRICDFIAAFFDQNTNTQCIEAPNEPVEDNLTSALMLGPPTIMTEAEWLTSADPEAMLACLGSRISDRKLRLFACACCRRIWHLIPHARARATVEAAERYADGLDFGKELHDVATGSWAPIVCSAGVSERQALEALQAAACLGHQLRGSAGASLSFVWQVDKDRVAQANLLRDLVGNPYRPASVDPAWRTCNGGLVSAMAQQMYDDRTFHLLPILADAFEEAGCTEASILEHLRGPGSHARGCWAVDALIGKA
jgi:pSer/pThr/pTyr-binding forkhead associated (FHA) protein